MKSLVLKKTAAHYGGDWPDDDHVVLHDGAVVGRILFHPQGPEGRPWLWSISSRIPQSPEDRGYTETCEQAMVDFKLRWIAT
jgi:hypothetical protein